MKRVILKDSLLCVLRGLCHPRGQHVRQGALMTPSSHHSMIAFVPCPRCMLSYKDHTVIKKATSHQDCIPCRHAVSYKDNTACKLAMSNRGLALLGSSLFGNGSLPLPRAKFGKVLRSLGKLYLLPLFFFAKVQLIV